MLFKALSKLKKTFSSCLQTCVGSHRLTYSGEQHDVKMLHVKTSTMGNKASTVDRTFIFKMPAPENTVLDSAIELTVSNGSDYS